MPNYSRACWKAYLEDPDAYKLVHCVYDGIIGSGGKLNAMAIQAFVNLARNKRQKNYIELDKVKHTKGRTGGLYPWLIKYGADILEQKAGSRAYRIQKEFYYPMLGLFSDANYIGSTQGIMRLQGLGNEIWAGIDAQDYVHRERASWGG